jgi:hypothetical protein
MTETKNVLTAEQREQLATEIFNWLVDNDLWIDVSIYFNGKRWSTMRKVGEEYEFCYNERRYFESEADPKDYFEYVREPENILSMSFEGSLYEILNGYVRGWAKLEDEFRKIFDKYGVYPQMGNAWNLTCFEI